MAKTDDPDHRYRQARKRVENSDIAEDDKDAILDFLDALNPEKSTVNFYNDRGERETKTFGTLAAYAQALKRVGELSEQRIVDFSDESEVNELFDDLGSGEHPAVSGDGYNKSTLVQWESAVTKFFEYHDDLGVNHEEVVVERQEKTAVDDRDMYTKEEVQAMRDAVNNTRDRCLVELLLNTGQRIRAIQTLRVKDVQPDEGIYYLNTDELGLKGADKNGHKRPLLGAKRAVYDWLKDHPTDEPDDYLITCLPTAARGTPGEKLSQSNIRERLRRIADDAGIDKPPNPHNFRHYFVTVCKRDYEMDESTIKHLIGHGQKSRIMETTYQHLNDDDHIEAAEVAAGLREPEEESPLTPEVCPTCSESLQPNAKACPACGTVFTPDAKALEDDIDEDMKQSYAEADPDDTDTIEKLQKIDEILNDPEVKEILAERMGDE